MAMAEIRARMTSGRDTARTWLVGDEAPVQLFR